MKDRTMTETDRQQAASAEPEGGGRISVAIALVAVVYLVVLGYVIQNSFSGMADGDSYLHTRMANLLVEEGPMRAFPWTQFSVWKDKFQDKDFLFHVLLAPFCTDEDRMVEGGKLVIWMIGSAFFALFAWVLFKQGFRNPALWIVILALTCDPIFGRIVRVRPQVLSMVFALLCLHFILEQRYKTLFVLSYLFALAHTSAPLVVIMGGLHFLAARLAGEKSNWRIIIYPAAGLLAGFVINPFFPNNFYLWYLQAIEVPLTSLSSGESVPISMMGMEFLPVTTRDLLLSFRFLLPLLGILAVWGMRKIDVFDKRTLSLALNFLFYLLLGFLSERYLYEFWIIPAIMLCASLYTRLDPLPALRALLQRKRLVGGAVLILVLCYTAYFAVANTIQLYEKNSRLKTCDVYERGIDYLRRNAGEGELVFHPSWMDFASLFHFNVKNLYMVGSDPCFLYFYDKDLFWKLRKIETLESETLGTDIIDFGARWAYLENARNRYLIPLLQHDPRFEMRYSDKHCTLFYILPK